MIAAAQQDDHEMKLERPAVFKLKMLDEVQAQASKKLVVNYLLENGILSAFK